MSTNICLRGSVGACEFEIVGSDENPIRPLKCTIGNGGPKSIALIGDAEQFRELATMMIHAADFIEAGQ